MRELIWNGDFWVSKVSTPFQMTDVEIFVYREDGTPPSEKQRAMLNNIDFLPSKLLEDINTAAVGYVNDVDNRVNLSRQGISIDLEHLANHYKIKRIIIPELFDAKADFFIITADCDWDEEHGMEVLIENNRVLYCGPNKGITFSPFWEDFVNASNETKEQSLKKLLT